MGFCLFVRDFVFVFVGGVLRLRVGSIMIVFGWGVDWMGAVAVAVACQERIMAAAAPSISRGLITTAHQAQTALQNQGEEDMFR